MHAPDPAQCFVDCHVHLLLGGLTLSQLDLSRVNDRESFERAIAERHAALPQGAWLQAHGWDHERWGGRLPDRLWLREAPDRPVVAYRMDQHACLVNDTVLGMIDLEACPPGGMVVRNAGGEPTGMLLEQAAWRLVNPIVPAPSVEEKQAALRAACAHAAALGISAVCSMEYFDDVERVYEPLRAELPIRVAITLLDRGDEFDVALARRITGDDRLWINGFKAFADGTLGSRTARMLEPYADDLGNRGMLVENAADGTLREWARAVIDAGLSPSIHAIGDEALRVALDAIEPIDAARVTRFEHCQTIHPDDVPRLRGRLVSMQPHHRTFDRAPAHARLGPSRMNRFFPFRALIEHGAVLGFGSDWPIVDIDPRQGMIEAQRGADAAMALADADGNPASAGSPRTPCAVGDDRLTEREAIDGYTRTAWRFLRAHERSAGKSADAANESLARDAGRAKPAGARDS